LIMPHTLRSSPAFIALVVSTALFAQDLPALGDLCPGGAATGTGLRAAYYSDAQVTSKPVLIQHASEMNLDAAQAARRQVASGGSVEAARWCGWIRPVVSGPHQFPATAKGMRVEINKKTVTDASTGQLLAIEMQAGQAYAILVEISDIDGARGFDLQWTPPFGVTYTIPPSVLFPPVETVNPGC